MNITPFASPERQIVLDTETTGMNLDGSVSHKGHKIIEIGAVEVINRRLTGNHFHVYINPKRQVEEAAFAIHGLSDDFLKDKPIFSDIAEEFIRFISKAELIIHNAPFDMGFIDHEFSLMKHKAKLSDLCKVTDTLVMARRLFPGKRNNLDVLCERYQIDNSHRRFHGALLDAELLAEVYLAMTGGQTLLSFTNHTLQANGANKVSGLDIKIERAKSRLPVIRASSKELSLHEQTLDNLEKKSGAAIWRTNPDTDK